MRILLATIVLFAAVAAFDAVRGEHWDQFAMLVAIVVVAVAALALYLRRRPGVRPRSDLMAWLADQAALTDDSPDAISDRALAAYRAEFLPGPKGGSSS
jgi:predicted Co/Zn/Cd cation transporter (cation efflux family)